MKEPCHFVVQLPATERVNSLLINGMLVPFPNFSYASHFFPGVYSLLPLAVPFGAKSAISCSSKELKSLNMERLNMKYVIKFLIHLVSVFFLLCDLKCCLFPSWYFATTFQDVLAHSLPFVPFLCLFFFYSFTIFFCISI